MSCGGGYGVATISRLLILQVSFAKVRYKRDDILQKRPIISRSLLMVATPYFSHQDVVYVSYLLWMGHVPHEWVTSPMKKHAWLSHVTLRISTMNGWTCFTSLMNGSRPTWNRHVPRRQGALLMNESCHVNTSHVPREVLSLMNGSCHVWTSHVPRVWVMSHAWLSHVTLRISTMNGWTCVISRTNESRPSWWSHVTHITHPETVL